MQEQGALSSGEGIDWRRLLRDALWVAGPVRLALFVMYRQVDIGSDAHAYWMAWRSGLYVGGPGHRDAFLYSPAVAQAFRPLVAMPWPLFYAMWTAASALAFWWLLRPLGWQWAVPLWLLCLSEALSGNVIALFAVVIAVGLRRPAAWAFPLLAKVTPAVGLVWFAVRREWRALGEALGIAAAITLVSFVAAPQLWIRWVHFLAGTHETGQAWYLPFYGRLPLGLALTAWGARRGKTWVLPVGVFLASPMLWPNVVTIFAALPRLVAVRGTLAAEGGVERVRRRLVLGTAASGSTKA